MDAPSRVAALAQPVVWTWASGFLLGLDGGVQFKLSSTQTVVIPPGADTADPNLRKNINNIVDAGTSYPLPSLHLRIGWQY